jgi:hypothetical protein
MEDAPYNLEVVGQIRLQATIRGFLGVVIVTSIGGKNLIDVTRLVLDFLYFDGEEVANIDHFDKLGQVDLVVIHQYFSEKHFFNFKWLSFVNLVSNIMIFLERQHIILNLL